MTAVGLTGGIGSGKSTVATMLAELGAHVVDADQLAREVVAPQSPGLQEIAARFGAAMLTADGVLDRAALGARVFSDPEARAALEAILHPKIAALAEARLAQAPAGALPVYDVPLLFERGLDARYRPVVVVYVPPALQRARVAARDGLSPAEIEARIGAQLSLDDKAARADHVIRNDGPLDQTAAQVRELYARLRP